MIGDLNCRTSYRCTSNWNFIQKRCHSFAYILSTLLAQKIFGASAKSQMCEKKLLYQHFQLNLLKIYAMRSSNFCPFLLTRKEKFPTQKRGLVGTKF